MVAPAVRAFNTSSTSPYPATQEIPRKQTTITQKTKRDKGGPVTGIPSQKQQDALIEYCNQTYNASYNTFEYRSRLQALDREYARENNLVKETIEAKGLNQGGDKRKIQDIVVPIVEPQVETTLTYLVNVFLSKNPIFGFLGDPSDIDAVRQMEAIVSENGIRGGWVRQLTLWLRDGLKYNFHAAEVDWKQKTIWSLQNDEQLSRAGQSTNKEVLWEGNVIKRCDPYNLLFDARVAPAEQHTKAEFVGYIELLSRIALKQYINDLPWNMNATKAFESQINNIGKFYIPQLFNNQLVNQNMLQTMDWMQWATGIVGPNPIQYHNIYALFTRYCRILPSDFGLNVPAPNTPQIWKIVTVNDQVPIFFERLTNAHDYLPIIFGQPVEDGLGWQTKSFMQKLLPMQDIASALWNSRLAARRRAISDRAIYDPLRISKAEIESDSPSAKIAVRPSAYGTKLSEAYYPIPFRDEYSSSFVQDAREVMSFANFISGQNNAQQGQFVKGNKTQAEYDNIIENSGDRQKTLAIFLEAQAFVPIKEIIKLNILQYQPQGTAYHYGEAKTYTIDPVALRNASIHFKVTDGLEPKESFVNPQLLQTAVQAVSTSPVLAQQYNVANMFEYLMSLGNVYLSDFRNQQGAGVQTQQQEQAEQETTQQQNPQEEQAEQAQATQQPGAQLNG